MPIFLAKNNNIELCLVYLIEFSSYFHDGEFRSSSKALRIRLDVRKKQVRLPCNSLFLFSHSLRTWLTGFSVAFGSSGSSGSAGGRAPLALARTLSAEGTNSWGGGGPGACPPPGEIVNSTL